MNEEYSRTDIEEMTSMGIFMLLEEKGADTFGLFAASKSVLLKSYEDQVGFKA